MNLKKKRTKSFDLAGGAKINVDLMTGKETISIPVVVDEKMGVEIRQILMDGDSFSCGDNARLSIHEKFVANENTEEGGSYTYTDSTGFDHILNERFYYISKTGDKITVEKTAVRCDSYGALIAYTEEGIKQAYCSLVDNHGIEAATKLKNINYIEYFEQRLDEIKQLEEKINAYKRIIADYQIVDETGNLKTELTEFNAPYSFEAKISTEGYALSQSEVLSLKSLLVQRQGLEKSNSFYAPAAIESLDVQIISLGVNEANYGRKLSSFQAQKANINRQMDDTTKQIAQVEKQIQALKDKNAQYRIMLKEYFTEYLNLRTKLKTTKLQIPASYLSIDGTVRCFNEDGKLIAIYDKLGKCIVIEYSLAEASAISRATRIFDQKEREIVFSYNGKNAISEIVDSQGKRTVYEYYENDTLELKSITYYNGKTVSFAEADGKKTISCENNVSEINYNTNARVTSIVNSTYVSEVSHGNIVTTEELNEISKLSFTYANLKTTVLDAMKNGHNYLFDADGEILRECTIKSDLVVSAQEFSRASGKLTQTRYAKKDCLYVPLSSFVFVTDYCKNFDYDSENRIKQETISNLTVTYTTSRNITTDYVYDKQGRLSKQSSIVETNKNGTVTTQKEVQLFEYNQAGQLLCKKSYVEGEEAINGIDIEEHIYNKDGLEIKSIVYNSLDPSSKLYEEREYDENGQVTCQINSRGEHKSHYEHTQNGKTELLPSGARLSYGYSNHDGNSAITMSTENGEENSIQRLYTNGFLTRVVSGDDIFDYYYDCKGRVTKIYVNGSLYSSSEYEEKSTELCRYAKTIYSNNYEESISDYYMSRDDYVRNENFSRCVTRGYRKGLIENIWRVAENLESTTNYQYNNQYKILIATESAFNENVQPEERYKEEYTYNSDGLLEAKVILRRSNLWKVYQYSYSQDSMQKLEKIDIYENANGSIELTARIYPVIDALGRSRGKSIFFGQNKIYSEDITYLKQGDHATRLPLTISYGKKENDKFVIKDNIKYKYDSMGNICQVKENGRLTVSYEYDFLGRLVRENNKAFGKTYLFRYDNKGNILEKLELPYTTAENDELNLDSAVSTEYVYENGRLVIFGNDSISYTNSMGLPNSYRGHTLAWEHKKLYSYGSFSFAYDSEGRRTSKNNITFQYGINGELIEQSNGVEFLYDMSSMIGIRYGENAYFFKKDILGNVIELLDSTGATVVKYVYDAWGNHKVLNPNGTVNTVATFIGHINPIRYRSYYYDIETGLYYLQSRYYDPQTGRFISMDDINYLDPETIGGTNLYAYCLNNPVMCVDPTGHFGIGLTLLIATGVGLALGFGIEVVKQASNGGKFWDLSTWNWDLSTWNWWEIGKASLIGAATGFAYGLGGVAGGIVKGSFYALTIAGKALTVSQSVGLLLGTAAVTNFVAGVVGYAMHAAGSGTESFNILKGISEGIGQTGKGALSFFTAGMYVSSGVWKVGVGAKNTLSSILGRAVGKFIANYMPNYMFENIF